jgi:hypothetical protein
VSYQLHATAALVLSQVRPCGICGGRSVIGVGLRVLRFPMPLLIPATASNSLIVLTSMEHGLIPDIVAE